MGNQEQSQGSTGFAPTPQAAPETLRNASDFRQDSFAIEKEFLSSSAQRAALRELGPEQSRQFFAMAEALIGRADANPSVRTAVMNELRAILTQEENGRLSLLRRDYSSEGATLLDHWYQTAIGDESTIVAPALSYVNRTPSDGELFEIEGRIQKRDSLLRSSFREVLHVHGETEVRQGVYTSCVSTRIMQSLILENPAEYARLLHEWSRGGALMWEQSDPTKPPTLTKRVPLDPNAFSDSEINQRSYSGSVFQDSCARYFGAVKGGYLPGAWEDLKESLSRHPQVRIDSKVRNGAGELVDNLPVVFQEIDQALADKRNIDLSLIWAKRGDGVSEHNNHCVGIVSRKNGRTYFQIYFRDKTDKGFEYDLPKSIQECCTLEDEDQQIFSIDDNELAQRLNFIMVDSKDPNEAFAITEGADDPENQVLTNFSLFDKSRKETKSVAAPLLENTREVDYAFIKRGVAEDDGAALKRKRNNELSDLQRSASRKKRRRIEDEVEEFA